MEHIIIESALNLGSNTKRRPSAQRVIWTDLFKLFQIKISGNSNEIKVGMFYKEYWNLLSALGTSVQQKTSGDEIVR